MNKHRLYELIKDMNETLSLLDVALLKINSVEDELINTLIKSSIKQSFLEYFILIENFTCLCLKDLKIYKISDDMQKSLDKLFENNIITADTLSFLNDYRKYRNRIAHVYKQPPIEEIIKFLEANNDKLNEASSILKDMYKKLQ